MAAKKRDGDGAPRQRFELSVHREGEDVVFAGRVLPDAAAPDDPLAMLPNPRARLYSPNTVAILRLLCREEKWVTADAVAAELKLPKDRVVEPILKELGQEGCGWVESRAGNAGGFMLQIPGGEKPDEYRQKFAAWLDLIDRPGG